ncbi:hypothetical protein BLS_007981 [Venturia inaequalis]|uniref:Uncharacterized protein n=1 Tax=Venturia inaequalis TaxID=5025 RepID=A0A8H3U795_VENIN|nr:hypothetical protein BLS_007981 [Venturia inaequalis]
MRYSSFAVAALVGGSAAAPAANEVPTLKQLQKLAPRQMDALLGAVMPSMQAKVVDMQATYKTPGSKRIRITIGPFALQPANAKRNYNPTKMDPNSDSFTSLIKGLPQDIMVLQANSTITYADGTPADVNNGFYNHHLMVMDMSKSPTGPIACPDGKVTGAPVSPFFGASEANRDLQFVAPGIDFNGGYYVGKNDKLMLSAELVNYTNKTKDVYAQTEMEYVPGKPTGAIEIGLQVLEVDQCSAPPQTTTQMVSSWMGKLGGLVTGKAPADSGMMEGMIMAPKDKKQWEMTSKEMSITQDGFILFRIGHIHDGGEAVYLNINGQPICESKATYGGESFSTNDNGVSGKKWETISNMATCVEPVKVMKNDKISVSAKFDTEAHPSREMSQNGGMGEQMGTMTFMFGAALPQPKM